MPSDLPFDRLQPAKSSSGTRHGFERRGAPRYTFVAPLRWDAGEGRTINISATGILFETTAPPQPSAVLKVTIANPFGPDVEPHYVFCDVTVVRVEAAKDDEARHYVAGRIASMRFH